MQLHYIAAFEPSFDSAAAFSDLRFITVSKSPEWLDNLVLNFSICLTGLPSTPIGALISIVPMIVASIENTLAWADWVPVHIRRPIPNSPDRNGAPLPSSSTGVKRSGLKMSGPLVHRCVLTQKVGVVVDEYPLGNVIFDATCAGISAFVRCLHR